MFYYFKRVISFMGFPGGSEVKKKKKKEVCNAGDMGSNPGSERSPGEGNRNSLQYSCLKNPMDSPIFLPEESHGQRSLEGYSLWGLKESDMTEHTHTHAHTLNATYCSSPREVRIDKNSFL